jgi:pyruvate/2-oxoglutarate dehydrogenase complex dihydrolipoamide dehydrogenase (E3) component
MTRSCDLLVIGGGAGGLVAAREARRRGASTILVQDGRVGGDCTFTGCVPSKGLLAAAARGEGFTDAMGLVHGAIERIAATEDAAALARDGIEVVDGRARLVGPDTVEVDGTHIRGGHLVIATGSRPAIPPVPGLADVSPLTNETLFELDRRPDSLTILGAGPMGCEMAQAFARLGTAVTLVEADDRILPREEPDTSAVLTEVLTDEGVAVHVGVKAERVERSDEGRISVRLADGHVVESDELLVAAGRLPTGRGFGLEEVGVELDHRGAVVVDATMATSVRGIWAVGDVTGGLALTHVAGRQGWIAASNALAKTARVRRFHFDPSPVPWAVFTSPELGRVGLTESEAAQSHPSARVAHLDLSHVDRAVATGAERGFVKLIAAPRPGIGHLGGGRIIGASIVAPTGGDLIHEAALAMQTGMMAGRLAQTTHAYPTWAMAIQQAALQFFGTSAGAEARTVQA